MSIASFCNDLLSSEGPLPLEILTERVVAAGLTRSSSPRSTVKSALRYRAVELADDLWASPVALLEGRCLTTRRLAVPDRWDSYGYGDTDRYPAPDAHDLAPLTRAARLSGIPLRGGGTLHDGSARSAFSCLEPDRIPRAEGESALCLRIEGGVLDISIVELDAAAEERGRALATALGPIERARPSWQRADDVHGVADDLTNALWGLLAADPSALREPVPPLSECVSALAVALSGHYQRAFGRPAADLLDRLPRDVQTYISDEARCDEMTVDAWLEAFIVRKARQEDIGRHYGPYGAARGFYDDEPAGEWL